MHERKCKNFYLFFDSETIEQKAMNGLKKIIPACSIPEVDRYTLENEPVTSLELMERAAGKWVEKAVEIFPGEVKIAVLAGNGNNGGDGYVIARLLREQGYEVVVYQLLEGRKSPDCEWNSRRWEGECVELKSAVAFQPDPQAWIVDALFGTGLNRQVSGVAGELIRKVNSLPNPVIAVDMPSGLMGEDNSRNDRDAIVQADYTLTFQCPKLAFMFPENEPFVGKWQVLDIGLHPQGIAGVRTDYYCLSEELVRDLLPRPSVFAHKGSNGYALLIAGSRYMMGAAVLAAKAAVRSGVGLLFCHVPQSGVEILQTAVPEALIEPDCSDRCFTSVEDMDRYTAVGVGPAIGKNALTVKALEEVIRRWRGKMVLDADALNILAENRELLSLLPVGSILTPHPKEFERLAGKSGNDFERLNKLSNFAQQYQVVMLLKGAHTIIATPDGKCYFNMTGNPGMAKGGMGDVLTGVLLALLASGMEAWEAAMIGVFAHGLAGDRVAAENGMRGTCAGLVAEAIGRVWKILE